MAEVFALTGYVNAADLALRNPRTQKRYAFVVSTGLPYQWASTSTATIDNVNVIGNVSNTGRWLAVSAVITSSTGADLTDADATLLAGSGKLRKLPVGTLTANRTLTLSTTGASAGSQIEITRLDIGAFTVAIVNGGAGAGTLCTLPASVRSHALLEFDGTNWFMRDSGLML